MILYYGTRTAWTGELIADIMRLCHPDWRADDEYKATWYNLKSDLVQVAEVILTSKDIRKAEVLCPEINRLTRNLMKIRREETCWEYKDFQLKGKIPGDFYIWLGYSERDKSVMLDVRYVGKIVTWESDVMVSWLARYNNEILQMQVLTEEDQVLMLGEYLAAHLYKNCGDIAGYCATLDAAEDRKK